MASFDYTKNFEAGNVIVADDVMANFNTVRTFVVGANLNADNLATPYTNFVVSFEMGTIASGSNEVRRFRVPAGQEVRWVEAQLGRSSGGGTGTLEVTDAGTSGSGTTAVLSASLANGSADSVAYTTSFAASTTNAASYVLVKVTGSGGADTNDVHVTLWGKIKLRS